MKRTSSRLPARLPLSWTYTSLSASAAISVTGPETTSVERARGTVRGNSRPPESVPAVRRILS
jgi:hypothetical protein